MTQDPKHSLGVDQEFEDFYRLWETDLNAIAGAYSYRFKSGWSSDHRQDAQSAVRLVWWQAVMLWKPSRGDFGKLFWSMWKNHMASVGRKTLAEKRPTQIVTFDHPDEYMFTVCIDYTDLLTYTDSEEEHAVIGMLALGYKPTEVCKVVGRRTYYRITNQWKESRSSDIPSQ